MTFLNTDIKIATHTAVTTNVHGTGAGNVIVGNDELSALGVISSGSYLGNYTTNTPIAHGLGRIPLYVGITRSDHGDVFRIIKPGMISYLNELGEAHYPVTAMDATNFYVGNSTDYPLSANSGNVYYWVAIG